MYILFVLVCLATLVAISFWTVKYIKHKGKQGEKSKFTGQQIKKHLIIAAVVSFVSFICFGITAPKVEIYSEDNQNVQNGVLNSGKKGNTTDEENIVETEPTKKGYSKEDIEQAISKVPAYSKEAYAVVNNNIPFFNDTDLTTKSYKSYSNLDSLGRCGVAMSSVGKDIMPTEDRGNIGSIKPTGWHSVRYDGIDGNYLYNRCHLIGYQLTGENANENNLITGTRYMNVTGMLPFENMVADYIKETNNHVLYRVTPVFEGDNLLVSGVLIEAKSVEDDGKGIEFNVYCYNVQPGITIDYATGESSGPEFKGSASTEKTNTNISTYILNTNTRKYHKLSCRHASSIKESNKQTYEGTSEELDSKGYEPCKVCNP